MRRLCLGLVAALVLAGASAFATGWIAAVGTYGNSMAPRMETGDLVVVAHQSTYQVGDVVAYSSDDLNQVVLHRIVAIDDGRYTFRGDHNDFDDPEQPTADQLIGKELLHIPNGKVWADRLTSPPALAALAFGLLASGGATTCKRRRRKKKPMAQHAAASQWTDWWTGLLPRTRTATVIAATAAVIGMALGAYAWGQPVTASENGTSTVGAQMTFSYSASVPRSPAYDDTTVTAPDPLFRTLVDQVQVEYAYQGVPGQISVSAELSSASGWHTEMPLHPAVTFDSSRHTGTVDVDLDALDARAQAAAEATSIPTAQVEVVIVARVETVEGAVFAPGVTFALTPLTFQLASDASSLSVQDSTTAPSHTSANIIEVAGRDVPVARLRSTAALLIVGGTLAGVAIALISRRGHHDEHARLRRQHASLLLHVEPVTSPSTRPVVDVVDLSTLARLAERYGLLILHWTRSGIETFIVQDDGMTYRYRVPIHDDAPAPAPASVSNPSI